MGRPLRWFFFGCLVSLLPLLAVYLELRMRFQTPTIEQLIGGGELLVITWVLAAGALGELFGTAKRTSTAKLFLGGTIVLIVISAAMFFASVAEAKINGIPVDAGFIAHTSIWLFALSLPPCWTCAAVGGD